MTWLSVMPPNPSDAKRSSIDLKLHLTDAFAIASLFRIPSNPFLPNSFSNKSLPR